MSHSPEVIAAATQLKQTIEEKRAQMHRRHVRRNALAYAGALGVGAVVSGIICGGFGYSLGMDQAQTANNHLETVPVEAGHYRPATAILSPDGTPLTQPHYRVWCQPDTGHGTLHEVLDIGDNHGTTINTIPHYEGCPADINDVHVPAPLSGLIEIEG